jgi:2',3'-cyclic-nucleotide 2'-phosphodiesterase (5'-nucleotidase family)
MDLFFQHIRGFVFRWPLLFCISFYQNARAEIVQILHTNDIHSYLWQDTDHPEFGGYAAIKEVFEKLENEAPAHWTTLKVDAGDFLEGNLLYIAEQGAGVLNIIQKMDYDVMTIGNHDWLMGTLGLDGLLTKVAPKVPILGANFSSHQEFEAINKHIKPWFSLKINDINLTFLGLTTDSLFYKWAHTGGTILNPVHVGNEASSLLKNQLHQDFVIALTHLGLSTDKKVVKNSYAIDLVIGGHSHDELFKPVYEKNQWGKKIPIVQAGKHGQYVGRLVLDLKKDQPLKILSYELIPVLREKGESAELLQNIAFVEQKLVQHYREDKLNKIVAHSEVALTNSSDQETLWGHLVADAFRDAFDSDVGVHVPVFAGDNIPVGPISRRQIMEAYPRFFEFEQDEGWYIYHSEVKGWFLRLVLNVMLESGYPLYMSGVTFDVKKGVFGNLVAKNIRVKGDKLRFDRNYTLAVPEGIVRGSLGISKLITLILKNNQKSSMTIWDALEEKLTYVGHVNNEYLENYNQQKAKKKGQSVLRKVVFRHKDIE